MQRKAVLYDKAGDQHYDYISAWIKATRGSDPDASLYYLAAMLEGGEDARFIARRMVILASEDVGNADPQALLIATATADAVEHVGLPEGDAWRSRSALVTRGWRRSRTRPTSRSPGLARHIVDHGAAAAAGRAAQRRVSRRCGVMAAGGAAYEYPHDEPGSRQRPGAHAGRSRGSPLLSA